MEAILLVHLCKSLGAAGEEHIRAGLCFKRIT